MYDGIVVGISRKYRDRRKLEFFQPAVGNALIESSSRTSSIRDSIWDHPPDFDNRNDQSAVTRLRIGHTNPTHVYLFERTPGNQCEYCGTPLSVQHIIIDCPKYQNQRVIMCLPLTFKECLTNKTNAKTTREFSKAINLYKQL